MRTIRSTEERECSAAAGDSDRARQMWLKARLGGGTLRAEILAAALRAHQESAGRNSRPKVPTNELMSTVRSTEERECSAAAGDGDRARQMWLKARLGGGTLQLEVLAAALHAHQERRRCKDRNE